VMDALVQLFQDERAVLEGRRPAPRAAEVGEMASESVQRKRPTQGSNRPTLRA
jgi:hypothetical protein